MNIARFVMVAVPLGFFLIYISVLPDGGRCWKSSGLNWRC